MIKWTPFSSIRAFSEHKQNFSAKYKTLKISNSKANHFIKLWKNPVWTSFPVLLGNWEFRNQFSFEPSFSFKKILDLALITQDAKKAEKADQKNFREYLWQKWKYSLTRFYLNLREKDFYWKSRRRSEKWILMWKNGFHIGKNWEKKFFRPQKKILRQNESRRTE